MAQIDLSGVIVFDGPFDADATWGNAWAAVEAGADPREVALHLMAGISEDEEWLELADEARPGCSGFGEGYVAPTTPGPRLRLALAVLDRPGLWWPVTSGVPHVDPTSLLVLIESHARLLAALQGLLACSHPTRGEVSTDAVAAALAAIAEAAGLR